MLTEKANLVKAHVFLMVLFRHIKINEEFLLIFVRTRVTCLLHIKRIYFYLRDFMIDKSNLYRSSLSYSRNLKLEEPVSLEEL